MNAHTAAEHDQLRLALTKARRQSDAWEAEARNLQRQLAAINERQAKTLYVRSVRLDIVEPNRFRPWTCGWRFARKPRP